MQGKAQYAEFADDMQTYPYLSQFVIVFKCRRRFVVVPYANLICPHLCCVVGTIQFGLISWIKAFK